MDLLKAGLMDASPQVSAASLDVLQALVSTPVVSVEEGDDLGLGVSGLSVGNDRGSSQSHDVDRITIPWSSWEARLALGSLVKTVVDKLGDSNVRVRVMIVVLCSIIVSTSRFVHLHAFFVIHAIASIINRDMCENKQVRKAAQEMAMLLAHVHKTGWQLVTRHVLAPVTLPKQGT